jgi:transposase
VDRDQLLMLPPSMRDWLPAGHLALLVEDVVAQMDTSALHGRGRRGGVGRAGYDPDMLLGLLVYGYAQAVHSSRKIEARCETDVAFRYLCAQDVPDHTVIARFRRGHAAALAGLLTEVLVVAVRLGMGRFGHLAIDGTKIAANASKDANRDVAGLRKLAGSLVADSIAVDDAEDTEHGDRRGDELPPSVRDRSGRRQRIAEALAKAEAAEQAADGPRRAAQARLAAAETRLVERVAQAQGADAAWQARRDADGICPPGRKAGPIQRRPPVARAAQAVEKAQARLAAVTDKPTRAARANLTDPDSRLLPTRHGQWVQGFNSQLVVSDDYLVTAVAIHDNPNDAAAFVPLMHTATATVATLAARTGTDLSITLITADAGYDTDTNLTTAGPDRLIAQADRHTTATAARDQPTSGPPPPQATARQQMAHRLRSPEGHTAYKRRAATVEPVHSHLKNQIGLRQYQLRGIAGATIELTLAAIAHNIRRLHTHQATA